MNPQERDPLSFANLDKLASLCENAYKGITVGKYIVSGVVFFALLALLIQINN